MIDYFCKVNRGSIFIITTITGAPRDISAVGRSRAGRTAACARTCGALTACAGAATAVSFIFSTAEATGQKINHAASARNALTKRAKAVFGLYHTLLCSDMAHTVLPLHHHTLPVL